MCVKQPEGMRITQLERETTIDAQADAITALAEHAGSSFAAVNALRNFMGNEEKGFCRLRGLAARVLGSTAGAPTNWMGLDLLLKFFKERCFDADVAQVKANNFSNLTEHFVNQAVVDAVAETREGGGSSAPEVMDFLVELLTFNNNLVNPWDDSHWRANVLAALGAALPPDAAHLKSVLDVLDHSLARDTVLPSCGNVVSAMNQPPQPDQPDVSPSGSPSRTLGGGSGERFPNRNLSKWDRQPL